ncbi:MAG: hypothetical protein GY909_09045 [Oligoflexia bacterium]|nr:hypothetical protein [Oligoflexia bacterium]
MKFIGAFIVILFSLNSFATCKVEVFDKFNQYSFGEPVFEIDTIDEKISKITYVNAGEDAWSEEFYFDENDDLVTTASVPEVDRMIITEEFIMVDDEQLKFTSVNCSEIERSLVYFFIMEWFLFG